MCVSIDCLLKQSLLTPNYTFTDYARGYNQPVLLFPIIFKLHKHYIGGVRKVTIIISLPRDKYCLFYTTLNYCLYRHPYSKDVTSHHRSIKQIVATEAKCVSNFNSYDIF